MAEHDGFDAALTRLAQARRLLVALDFDGTVAPRIDNPMEARALPQAEAALERLRAIPGTWTAYVSGRPIDQLAELTASDPDAFLIGSHGAELRIGADDGLRVSTSESARLEALADALEAAVKSAPGAWIEHKPVGLGLHTRMTEPFLVPRLHDAARAAAERIGGFRERAGHDLLEFSTRTVTKGYGLERLRNEIAVRAGADAVVLFAGDDETDEDALAVLRPGDVGVRVGPGRTRADFRVANPTELAAALVVLAGRRETAFTG